MNSEKKTLLIFATHEEASSTISTLQAQQQNEHAYIYSKGTLLITGMGMQAIYNVVPHYLSGISEIYNYGLAGAINRELPRFSVHTIDQVSMINREPIILQSKASVATASKGLHLLSVLKPQYTTAGIDADLVDMEGYAIGEIALQHQIPCTLIKVVSDYCDSSSTAQIKDALASLHFGSFLIERASAQFSKPTEEQVTQKR